MAEQRRGAHNSVNDFHNKNLFKDFCAFLRGLTKCVLTGKRAEISPELCLI